MIEERGGVQKLATNCAILNWLRIMTLKKTMQGSRYHGGKDDVTRATYKPGAGEKILNLWIFH